MTIEKADYNVDQFLWTQGAYLQEVLSQTAPQTMAFFFF